MVWIIVWIISIILAQYTIHLICKTFPGDNDTTFQIAVFIGSLIPIVNLTIIITSGIFYVKETSIFKKYMRWLYGN